jgi:ABC-type sugar transport system ATPase subunit
MSIELEQVSKHFGDNAVVKNVSLEVEQGELFVLLGASGSGKSTVLRIIAGLASPDSGRVCLNGRDVTNEPPRKRGPRISSLGCASAKCRAKSAASAARNSWKWWD